MCRKEFQLGTRVFFTENFPVILIVNEVFRKTKVPRIKIKSTDQQNG